MNSEFADLPKLLGDTEVLIDDEAVEPFGSDRLRYRGKPGAVVRPRTTEQVAALMALSAQRGFPVFPRGAATNLCGSVSPRAEGVVVDLSGMDRILSVDEEALRASVQPGVINGDLQSALAPSGLCWSPDPASRPISSVGGNISTNAGGPGCIKYGVTFHHVVGVQVVLADGRVIELADDDPVDLLGLMIGSEGTLGLVTRADLGLRQIPTTTWTVMAAFPRIEEAAEAVSSIIAARIDASALELLDKRGVEVVDAWRPSGYPSDADGLLFAELDGDYDEVRAQAPRLLEVLGSDDPNLRIARTPDERSALWAGRLGFAMATTEGGKLNFVSDVSVPRQKIPEMVTRARQIARQRNLDVPIVAHAGDGNLHPVILFNESDRESAFAGAADMTDVALDLGGTITGEHGVGVDKLPQMPRRFTPAELGSFRAIKRAFDPDGRLNPGVMLPPPASGEPVDETLGVVVAAGLVGEAGDGAGHGEDKTIAIDEDNLTLEVGAAAMCEEARKQLRDKGLRCGALDDNSTVGDAVARNDHDTRATLLAIDAELPHGRVRFGSAAVKDVAGLDAKRLLASPGDWVLEKAIFRVKPA